MTIPIPNTNEFRGKCPICSELLFEDARDPAFVYCSVSPKHYRIQRSIFDAAWVDFEEKILSKKNGKDLSISEVITDEDLSALMFALMNNNVGEEAPLVDPSKFTTKKEQ